MITYRSLIIDDERLARVSLRKKLADYPQIEIVGEAPGVQSGIQAIRDLEPQILFLDIQLTDGTGFDLLERISYPGKVVFVTAYDEHALRAFEVNALDYLQKPVSKSRLKSLIGKITAEESAGNFKVSRKYQYDDRIMIEQKGHIYFLQIRDILLIKSAKDYSMITTQDLRNFLVITSMNGWEELLPADQFFRAHRTTIVNLNRIEKTIRVGATAEIFMQNLPESIRVSRSYYMVLKQRYLFK